MKSIESLTRDIVAQAESGNVSAYGAVALAPRPAPLESVEIERLSTALGRCADEIKTPRYGYVAVKDAAGDIVGTEYDVVGTDVSYRLKGDMAPQLADALSRPARREHIVFHLARLATHRRDTRGAPAFSVVLEDIAMDLFGVSEWAVIMACKEMRQKEATWYPTTGEIEKIVLRLNDQVAQLVAVGTGRQQLTAPKRSIAEDDPRLSMDYRELARKDWLPQHFQWWLVDARKVLAGYEARGVMPKVEEWRRQIAQCEAAFSNAGRP